MIDFILKENDKQRQSALNTVPSTDADLEKTIAASMETAKEENVNLAIDDSNLQMRTQGTPVGLKNIGNTCYLNSLLQMYFMNHKFAKEVLAFIMPTEKIIE